MAKGHKPVSGSRGYWPRKRAKRIYPVLKLKESLKSKDVVPLGFAGYKAGMTQVVYVDNKKGSPTYGQEIAKAVTVLDCPSLVVCGIKLYKKSLRGLVNSHTILAESLSKDLYRKTNIPKDPKTEEKIKEIENALEEIDDVRLLVHTKPRESGIGKKKPELFEIPLGGSDIKQKWEYAKEKLGKELKAEEVFSEGEYVDSLAVTKGKGYEGPVKRFGIKIRPRKHEKKRRHQGVLGVRNVARVLPGKIAMAGQMGFHTRTEFNKRILKIGTNGLNPNGGWVNYGLVRGDFLILEGSVPGPKKRLIFLRKAVRCSLPPQPVEIKHVILEPQQ